MTARPERLDSESALEQSGALIERAIERAKLAGLKASNKALGESIGFSGESADTHMRGYRLGARPLTLPKLLQLCDAYPTLARSIIAELAAWISERGELAPASRIVALDNLVTEVLATAAEGHEIGRDRHVDDDEHNRMRGRGDRVRRALDAFDATHAPALRRVP
jgi:hypothetical protein